MLAVYRKGVRGITAGGDSKRIVGSSATKALKGSRSHLRELSDRLLPRISFPSSSNLACTGSSKTPYLRGSGSRRECWTPSFLRKSGLGAVRHGGYTA